ncbi:hypothetical protein B566_EDAN017679 [Ephemera danica]|nr:hypothetical protein B566_EDAN017679 [Ephemera danica]
MVPYPPESRLCQRTQWFYPENNPFSTSLVQTGLLCLHTDNLPQRYWIQYPKTIINLEEFKRFESRAKPISWPVSASQAVPELKSSLPYKSGDSLWTLKNNKTIQLFVQPFLCPLNVISEAPSNCSEVSNITVPSPASSGQVCDNVVVRARYVFQHNGTEGLLAAKVFMWLGSIPVHQLITQKLEVVFEWAGFPTNTHRRSGRPGYVQSSPVLVGALTEERNSVEAVSAESRLRLLGAGPGGQCCHHRPVLFHEDVLSECSVPLSSANFTRSGCANLTKKITQLLLGNSSLIHNLVVAAFGDSEWGTLTDWVPVIFQDIPSSEGVWIQDIVDNTTKDSELQVGKCGSVSTNLNIHILWSAVGSYSSPQSKILGCQLTFGSTQVLEPPILDSVKYIRLATSVKFSDLTPVPHSRYAPPPKYEIRLPRDFFYPLFTSSSASLCSTVCSVSMMVILQAGMIFHKYFCFAYK